jgi:hypothetical protein
VAIDVVNLIAVPKFSAVAAAGDHALSAVAENLNILDFRTGFLLADYYSTDYRTINLGKISDDRLLD